jgi:chromosome segregation ATPase
LKDLKSKLTETETIIKSIKITGNKHESKEFSLNEKLKKYELELEKLKKVENSLRSELVNIQQSNSFMGNEKKLIFEKNVEMIEHLNKLKDKLKDHKYWKETGL